MRTLIVLAPIIVLAGCGAMNHQRTTAMHTNHQHRSDHSASADARRLTIELLALDLATCGRCTRTESNLDSAIETVAAVLREADVDVDVRKTVVTSAAQAQRLRFQSSPTIRINGHDIAFELRESNCGDCGDLCGCDGQVDCRVWVWRGREYDEAPKALIIDALLRAYATADQPSPQPAQPFRLPDNLQRFFDAMSSSQGESKACCTG